MEKTLNLGKVKLTGGRMYKLLFMMLWIESTLYAVFYQVVNRLPVISDFSELVLPFLIILFSVVSFVYIFKNVKIGHVLTVAFFGIAVLMTMLFAGVETQGYLDGATIQGIFGVLLFVFVGAAFDLEKNERLLFWLSLATVVGSIFYQILLSSVYDRLSSYNMGAAYTAFPACVYLIYYAFTNKHLLHGIAAIVGCGFVVSCGARGPILCLMVVAVFLCIRVVLSIKSSAKKTIMFIILFGVVFLFANERFLYPIIQSMADWFGNIGASTRALDMIIEENAMYDSGRSKFIVKSLEYINENAIFGMGMMSDRVILDGKYMHNILYEMWCNFGVIIGTVVFLAIVIIPIVAIIKSNNKKEKMFIFAFASAFVIKLFLSSSYLLEEFLFFILGYSISIICRKTDESEA